MQRPEVTLIQPDSLSLTDLHKVIHHLQAVHSNEDIIAFMKKVLEDNNIKLPEKEKEEEEKEEKDKDSIKNIFLGFDTESPKSVAELRRRIEANGQGTKEQIDAAHNAIIQISNLTKRQVGVEKCKITKNEATYSQLRSNKPKHILTDKQITVLQLFLDKLAQLKFTENDPGGIDENTITIFLHYQGWHSETTGPKLLQLNITKEGHYTLRKHRQDDQLCLIEEVGKGIPDINQIEALLISESMLSVELTNGSSIVMEYTF
ncbi:MAG: hypothetical protein Barrevirus1_41 [Barrevirus sp.]|uniref:Uncharacterized protein n=1 Tax=Barrevirus sp. TaxID=2487763 RepID=A0A3G4ZTS2_9VIRU|nr:MAG: hypothetical protein Barrevirus1_41 [Barrevirus sp.]